MTFCTIAIRMFAFPLFAMCIALFFSGCGKRVGNVERGIETQHLHIGIGTEPEGLDPHLVTGVPEHYVLLSLLEGLVTVHPETLAIEPGVAKRWSQSDDGLRYTFYFDEEARWSNGDRVTPEDFLFSFERILRPELGAPYAYMLYDIENAEAFNKGELKDFESVGIRAIADDILEITLEAPVPYFLSLSTHYTWWPVHRATVLSHGSMTDRISKWTKPENFVGNGPFALSDWRLGNTIKVSRNPYYRDAKSVRLNKITFYPVNVDTEERAFRANQLHLTASVPVQRIDWYRENAPESVRFDTYLGVYYYLINTTEGPLSDPRVRKALAYSIDREALVEYVLKGGQKPAYHFTPPNIAGFQPKPGFSHDPELARDLLAEAGFPGGDGFPKFELLFNTSESHRAVAVAIQQMWKETLGIDIGLYNQEWKVYLKTRKDRTFDIARAAWIGDYVDANTFLSLVTSDNGNNHSNWGSEAYDSLIRTAALEADPKERLQRFHEAEAILADEMPVIPIYFYVRSLLIDPSVRGWHANILDYHPYQDVWLERPEQADGND